MSRRWHAGEAVAVRRTQDDRLGGLLGRDVGRAGLGSGAVGPRMLDQAELQRLPYGGAVGPADALIMARSGLERVGLAGRIARRSLHQSGSCGEHLIRSL